MLLHLADQAPLLAVGFELDLESVVDVRELVGREDGLDHDALDLFDAPDGALAVLLRLLALFLLLLLSLLCACFHLVSF